MTIEENTAAFKAGTAQILANYSNHPSAILALNAQSKVYADYIDSILFVRDKTDEHLKKTTKELTDFVAKLTADPNALLEMVLEQTTPEEVRQYLSDREAENSSGEVSNTLAEIRGQLRSAIDTLEGKGIA